MRQAVIYLRVSTIEQTTANQKRELREIASRMGCEIVKVYRDHGISGAKGGDKRPAFDKLCRDAARQEFDMVMAWSVDRLGRSLQKTADAIVASLARGIRDASVSERGPASIALSRIIAILVADRGDSVHRRTFAP